MITSLLWLLLLFVIILHFRQSRLRSDLEATRTRLWRLENRDYKQALDDDPARDAGPESSPAAEIGTAASAPPPPAGKAAPATISPRREPPPAASPPKAGSGARIDLSRANLDLPREAKAPAIDAGASAATPPQAGKPKPRSTGIEEMLGTRLYVWLGAIALSLAGIFLVRYAIDEGWLVPEVRITLGTLFGLSLLGAGERLRKVPRIGAALSAAGIAVLFASFYAATILYTLVPPLAGFLLMGLCGLLGIALALRQGQIVAVVGLIGSYLTPQLVKSSIEPSRMLFVYLMVLLLATLAVSRRRDWWPLAGSSLGAGLLWTMLWTTGPGRPGDSIWLGFFVFGSLLAFLLASWQPASEGSKADGLDAAGLDAGGSDADASSSAPALLFWPRILGYLALGASMLVQMRLLVAAGFDGGSWTFIGLMGATALILARLREDYRYLPWLTLGLTAIILFGWSGNPDSQLPLRFVGTVAAFGLLYAGGAWLAIWGSPRPDRWAILAGLSATGLYLLAYAGSDWGGKDLPWGLGAIGMGAISIAASLPVARRRASLAQGNASLAYLAAAATAFLSAAVPLELDIEWFAVAWSLELLALVWLAWRLEVPQLRRLAWPLAGLTALSLLGPWVLGYEIGQGRVFNWLLYGYGLPILAIAGGARFALRAGDRWLSELLQWLAIALGTGMLALQVRQGFHPGDLLERAGLDFGGNSSYGLAGIFLAQGFDFVEASSYAIAWLLLALGLLWAGRRWSLPVLPRACLGLCWLALVTLIMGPVLLANPLWAPTAVGDWPIFNRLLPAYGLPALLCLAASRVLAGWLPKFPVPGSLASKTSDPNPSSPKAPGPDAPVPDRALPDSALDSPVAAFERQAAGPLMAASLGLALLLVTLEVRQLFQGAFLDSGSMLPAENYSYSLAWVIFGSLLLVLGVSRASRLLRWASLPVMLIAVGKVFLLDTASLGGLYRVLSFLGLGLSLMLLGWVYQRYVFTERRSEREGLAPD